MLAVCAPNHLKERDTWDKGSGVDRCSQAFSALWHLPIQFLPLPIALRRFPSWPIGFSAFPDSELREKKITRLEEEMGSLHDI